jgi:AraC-like DNA-binding protein
MKTRYEEYHNSEVIMPCIPFLHIHRRFDRPSQATNWHDNPEIQLCVEGEGFVLIDGERYPFNQGDIIVVNSGQVHFTGTDSALTYHCLILDDTFCRMVNLPYQQTRFETAFRDEEMKSSILNVVALQRNEKDTFRVTKLQMEVARLLILLHQRHIAATRPKERSSPATEGVRAAIRYLREHYGEPVTLDALSRAVYMEKCGMCKAFKRLTGQTVIEYLNNYRCEKAKEFLATGKTVTETATLCGFHNMSYFTKTFKQATGKLPSAYKK